MCVCVCVCVWVFTSLMVIYEHVSDLRLELDGWVLPTVKDSNTMKFLV